MFVMKNGTSQHPPVQWPDGVVDAAVHFPYVLVLQNQTVHIYSILDQQLKQTVSLQSAKSVISTEGSFYNPASIFHKSFISQFRGAIIVLDCSYIVYLKKKKLSSATFFK